MDTEFLNIIGIVKKIVFYAIILADLVISVTMIINMVNYSQGKHEAGQNIIKGLVALAIVNGIYLVLYAALKLTGADEVANTIQNLR